MGKNQAGREEPKQKKQKKEKITYIDDGSTVADMSGTRGKPLLPRQPLAGKPGKPAPTTRSGQIWQTYKDAVRAMIGPMLVFIGGMAVAFFLVWLILGFFA